MYKQSSTGFHFSYTNQKAAFLSKNSFFEGFLKLGSNKRLAD
ncbi:hypothetical protein B0I21_10151 [Sphingobacterium paludis]|uniref:Uncharacterized protein n=1 Tax=Sphingobacterium paludis TaxID=1476465 RepID=A0A4R7D7M1_9SPHI|nr:hypothetical protein B0I21_10151 [Sphingobacterium paludis]